MPPSLWMNGSGSGAGLVLRGGEAVLCGHCPCGSGSGSGPCCGLFDPGNVPPAPFPDPFYLTVTGPDESVCPCIFGTFTMAFNPGNDVWSDGQPECPGGGSGSGSGSGGDLNGTRAFWQILCIAPAGGVPRMHLVFACVGDGGFKFAVALYRSEGEVSDLPSESEFCLTSTSSGSFTVTTRDFGLCCDPTLAFGIPITVNWSVTP